MLSTKPASILKQPSSSVAETLIEALSVPRSTTQRLKLKAIGLVQMWKRKRGSGMEYKSEWDYIRIAATWPFNRGCCEWGEKPSLLRWNAWGIKLDLTYTNSHIDNREKLKFKSPRIPKKLVACIKAWQSKRLDSTLSVCLCLSGEFMDR